MVAARRVKNASDTHFGVGASGLSLSLEERSGHALNFGHHKNLVVLTGCCRTRMLRLPQLKACVT